MPNNSRQRKVRGTPRKRKTPRQEEFFGAGGGTRTHTKSPSRDFKSRASAVPPHRRAVVVQSGILPPARLIITQEGIYFNTFCRSARMSADEERRRAAGRERDGRVSAYGAENPRNDNVLRDEQEQRRAFARRALARNGVGEYNLSVAVSSDRAPAAEERAGVCVNVCAYTRVNAPRKSYAANRRRRGKRQNKPFI